MPPPKDPVDRMRQALDKGGPAGLARATARIEKQAATAAEAYTKLAKAVDDPRFRKAAGSALAVQKETERLNATMRTRLDLEARRQAVTSGAYGRDLRAMQTIYREQSRIFELERRAQYESRYGRFGGRLAYHADAFSRSRAGMVAMAGGAAVGGLARSGFSGTVEFNRLQSEWQQISRELAGAFKPAIEAVTKGLQFLRKRLESLGPRGQDALMYGGGALAAYAGVRGIGMAGRFLGFGGGAAGGAAAAGGIPVGAAVAGGGLLAGGKSLLKKAGAVGALLTIGEELTDPDGFYERRRREGGSRFGSAMRTGGDLLWNTITFGGYADRLRAKGELGGGGGPDPTRRKVTLADAGFEAIGSGFERVTTSLALKDASDTDEKAGMSAVAKEIVGILTKIGEDIAAGKVAMPGR
jgi:hypothetical protein